MWQIVNCRNWMRYLAFIIVLSCATIAFSQPPNAASEKDQPPTNEDIRAHDAMQAIASQLSSIRQDAARAEKERVEREQWSTLPQWASLILTSVAVFATFITLSTLKRQTKAAEDAAKGALDSASAALSAVETAETGVVVQTDALATNREIERAYIAMDTKDLNVVGTPTGRGGWDFRTPTAIKFTVKFTNIGRTPGDLIGGAIGYSISPAPVTDVTRLMVRDMTRALLYPGKEIDFHVEITEDKELLARLMTGDNRDDRLWLRGIFDYRDRFGNFHTAGYCRCWHSTKHGHGFAFTPETGPLNYDRPMPDFRRRHHAIDKPKELEW